MKPATRPRYLHIALALVAASSLLGLPAGARAPQAPLPGIRAIVIQAKPIPFDRNAPQRKRFGNLDWMGTAELVSPSPYFGGYSGLVIDKTGTRLLAVSDTGSWLQARIVYREGRIAELAGARIGPLLGRNGEALSGKHDQDAEAITRAEAGGGKVYIGFERNHRIGVFETGKSGIGAALRYLPLPGDIGQAKANSGIEALTVLQAGTAAGALLALTEDHMDPNGNHIGWLIGGPTPGALTLKRRGGFAVTDLASLPNGDVLVLERRFRFSEGVKMRLRRIEASAVRPGALLDGEILLETDDTREIDNMEGLAAHQNAKGRTILTLISDNNFNTRFQRTLLMQFAIVDDGQRPD